MYKVSFGQTRPISSLPREYNKLIEEVKRSGEMVFLKGNRPHVVLVDYPYWEELMINKSIKEEKDALGAIRESELEYSEGKTKELKSLKEIWDLK